MRRLLLFILLVPACCWLLWAACESDDYRDTLPLRSYDAAPREGGAPTPRPDLSQPDLGAWDQGTTDQGQPDLPAGDAATGADGGGAGDAGGSDGGVSDAATGGG
jgi:hypothetical protein